MNNLSEMYFNMQCRLFPLLEDEIGEITEKLQEFLRIIELVKPARFIDGALSWCGLGRRMKSRESIFRTFVLKSVYDLPTTKVLIENLIGNSTWRQLCGWEYSSQVPSEATFSRAFEELSRVNLLGRIHGTVITENYKEKIVGHASTDSTAVAGREKACRKNIPKKDRKPKKRSRKSKAELAALKEQEFAEVRTRRLELQPNRSLAENLADLPRGCDWGGKQNSKGKTEYWHGYKLHLSLADGGVPLPGILTSERATVLYDLGDSAYDAPEIKEVSKALGRVPIIDPNKRRGDTVELDPTEKLRYRERSTVERGNSELKDNYGARHVRVKGHDKVYTHLMFSVIAITVKQLFNMLN